MSAELHAYPAGARAGEEAAGEEAAGEEAAGDVAAGDGCVATCVGARDAQPATKSAAAASAGNRHRMGGTIDRRAEASTGCLSMRFLGIGPKLRPQAGDL